MNLFFMKFHFTFLIIMAIIGNNFLKYNIFISNFPIVFYYSMCLFHIIYFIIKNKKIYIKYNIFLFFMIYCLFVIIMSYAGFYSYLYQNTLYYNINYIFNHVYIILLLPIAISMYISFGNNIEILLEYSKKYSIMLLFIFFVFLYFGYANNTISIFFVILFCFINLFSAKNLFYKLLFLIIPYFYLNFIFSESTAFIMIIIFTLFSIQKISIIRIKTIFKYLLISYILFLLSLYIFFDDLNSIIYSVDKNYWWRLNYWYNELIIIKEKYFLGVGFGTSYTNTSIFEVLSGGFINSYTGYSDLSIDTLFTTAQHSSYVNIIYRLGLVGFILFIYFTYSIFYSGKNDDKYRFLYLSFININIICMFNAGLESPQFIFIYYMSIVTLISIKRSYLNV